MMWCTLLTNDGFPWRVSRVSDCDSKLPVHINRMLHDVNVRGQIRYDTLLIRYRYPYQTDIGIYIVLCT